MRILKCCDGQMIQGHDSFAYTHTQTHFLSCIWFNQEDIFVARLREKENVRFVLTMKTFKEIVHPKMYSVVTICSPSCRSKPVWLIFFCGTQNISKNAANQTVLVTIDFQCMEKIYIIICISQIIFFYVPQRKESYRSLESESMMNFHF